MMILTGFEFQPPLDEYYISSEVGIRDSVMGGIEFNLHKGIDMVAPHHARVYAAATGIVVENWPEPNGYYKGHPVYGGMILISHGEGVYTLYAHLSKVLVVTNLEVNKGQIIGIQGNTGISTGEHLHFEIIIDPLFYFENND